MPGVMFRILMVEKEPGYIDVGKGTAVVIMVSLPSSFDASPLLRSPTTPHGDLSTLQ